MWAVSAPFGGKLPWRSGAKTKSRILYLAFGAMTQPTYLSVPDTPRSLGCNVHIGKLSLPVIVFFCLITLLHLPLYTLLLLLTSHKNKNIYLQSIQLFRPLHRAPLVHLPPALQVFPLLVPEVFLDIFFPQLNITTVSVSRATWPSPLTSAVSSIR